MNKIYDEESKELEEWKDSPAEVTDKDWREFLGDKRYQRAFVDFFEDELALKYDYDWKEVVNEYLYSGKEPLINGLIGGLGHRMHMGGRVDAGPYNRGADVPTFHSLVPTGEIANAEDRWRYGMELAGRMSTLPAYGPLDAMPPVSAAYSSSERFDQLNVRPHLHMVDAMLNDTWFDEAAIVQQLRALSSREQRELTADSWRMRRLVGGLSFAELKRGIADLPDMPLAEKMWWLGRSLHVPSWETVGYDEVRPMIVLAARTHPEFLAAMQTDAWRDVFLSICTDDTIHVAVADLRLTPALAADWIAHETSIF